MRQTKSEIYLHLVWATWERRPLVTEDIERDVYHCIEDQVKGLRCEVLAIGGLANHVHLVVKIRTTVRVSDLAKQVKGVSSTFIRDALHRGEIFRWQDGYGVFSISRSHLKRVIAYVENQKQRHVKGKIWDEWEETDEEFEGDLAEA